MPPAWSHVIVHYGELALKKGNRGFFENTLIANLRRRLEEPVRWLYGRLLIELTAGSDAGRVRAVLARTFGIANYAFALDARLDIGDITAKALAIAAGSPAATFRISARRPNKRFPYASTRVNEIVGAAVVQATGKGVSLGAPELDIQIEITTDGVFLYSEVEAGLGGLPAGVSGRVVALMSGGIDSPVAAILAMKRGCRCLLVHFHNYTFYKEQVRDKIVGLAGVLSEYNLGIRLVIVPFLDMQRAIVQAVSPAYRMIAYRRAMLRIAERLAEREGAKAFVTGDSVGQVASQTLDNLHAIGVVARRPLLAPLIANDKNETIRLARRFGTYDISTRRYSDCCSAFLAPHPETQASLEAIAEMEEDIDFEPLVRDALANAEIVECPDALGRDQCSCSPSSSKEWMNST